MLRKDIAETRAWDSSNNDYKNSDIQAYLNGDWTSRYEAGILSQIKEVKIPYIDGVGDDGIVASGANGLSRKVFLLSLLETGGSGNAYVDGAKLSYFEYGETSSANAKRQATLDGHLGFWWTRTASYMDDNNIYSVNAMGNFVYEYCDEEYTGVRPALILPSTALVDQDLNLIEEVS